MKNQPNPTTTRLLPGDFIAHKDFGKVCGIVESVGSIPFGKARIKGYKIRKGNGLLDFVPTEDAVLIAR